MRVLITGATGFIGSHAVEHYLRSTDWKFILLEGLNYASSMRRLTEMQIWEEGGWERCSMVFHDLRSPFSEDLTHTIGEVDAIINFAAETHVERSLTNPEPFIMSNFVGTYNLLEFARKIKNVRYVQISTDEVYGPAPDHLMFKEDAQLKPSNPYAATKAGSDCLVYSYFVSFGLDAMICRTMNNFGERQHPEKFIPKVMRSLMNNEPVLIHGTEGNVGSRCWLHARNHADAIKFVIQNGKPGEIYNVSSNDEHNNLDMAKMVSKFMGGNGFDVEYMDFHSCRPGHDRRYSLDGSKLMEMGWKPPVPFDESLARTVQWTMEHPEWLQLKK